MGKGENACDQHFLLFPQCLKKEKKKKPSSVGCCRFREVERQPRHHEGPEFDSLERVSTLGFFHWPIHSTRVLV